MTFDYTDCETLTPATSPDSLAFTLIPSNKFSYRLSSSAAKNANFPGPQYAFLNNTGNSSVTDVSSQLQCVILFEVPADLGPKVLLYYKLTNFFQNHRRYVKSLNSDQLKGKGVSSGDLESSNCKPLATRDGKPIYPCGLIANSFFNGTLSSHPLLHSITYPFQIHLHPPSSSTPPPPPKHPPPTQPTPSLHRA